MTNQVSRMQGYTANSEMSLVGYVIAAGVGFLLLPVLPLVAVVWIAMDRREETERQRGYAG